jgi:hypothetical protein
LTERRLLFDAASETLILTFAEPSAVGVPLQRVFYRGMAERRYRAALPAVCNDVSLTCPTLDARGALFVLNYRYMPASEPHIRALGQFDGVVRIDLATGAHEAWRTDQPGGDECFVSELCGISPDGEALIGVAGFGPDAQGAVEYAVVQLAWGARRVTRLGSLPGVFF